VFICTDQFPEAQRKELLAQIKAAKARK